MKISRIEQQQAAYRIEQVRQQTQRDEQVQAKAERKKFDAVVAERVNRARRLGLDKGQNVDVEC